jgi:LysM repeat protein
MNRGSIWSALLVCAVGVGLSGCVMKEQYEAEKNRALNFQRLLAQEEKRTGDLDAEAKRLKRDVPELEAKNRELAAQLQAVREQAARIKEENDALREAAAITSREALESKPKARAKAQPKPSAALPVEPRAEKAEAPVTDFPDMDKGATIRHEVKPGDTLFRISRQYGVPVGQLKDWNHLRDNMIEVGQKLIVGYQ